MNSKTNKTGKTFIVGAGSCGINILNYLAGRDLKNAEFIAIHTYEKALDGSKAGKKILIGSSLVKGASLSMDPDVAREAAQKDRNIIAKAIKSAGKIIIVAGMGGTNGTGITPVIAQVTQRCNVFTAGVVTMPFRFEGPSRYFAAQKGIIDLLTVTDTLTIINNDKLSDKAKGPAEIKTFVNFMGYVNDLFYKTIIGIL